MRNDETGTRGARRRFSFQISHLALLIAAAAAGCGPTKEQIQAGRGVEAYLNGNFPVAVEHLAPLAQKTDGDYVLNNLRLGATLMAEHDYDEAERAYVRAYQILNTSKVNDAGREAATVWLSESNKVWRGEPYERAVANLELGMIYYARGDYDNARGAFENALFKLRDYADPKSDTYTEQESNFAIALLMLGRTWTQLDRPDEAHRYFYEATQARPDLGALAQRLGDTSNNVLLYVEFGFGPHKIEAGMDGNALDFSPKPFQVGAVPPPVVHVDGRRTDTDFAAAAPFDTLAMALDRRWQKIDTIRKTKSYIGTGLMVAGAGAAIYGADRRDEGVALAGVGALAIGALLKASSAADTRVWEMTPRTAFVIPLRLPPGTHDLTIGFPDADRRLSQTWRGVVVTPPGQPDANGNTKGETTLCVRILRWTGGVYTWPQTPVSAEATLPAGTMNLPNQPTAPAR